MHQDDHPVREAISASISAALQAARGLQGATRDEVSAEARRAGAPETFTTSALRNIETARRGVTLDELVWLAAALRTPVRDLLGEHAELFGADVKAPPTCGPLEDATRVAIADLGELDLAQVPLAELAYQLAACIDDGVGMATAAVSKEYRATMADIFAGADPDDPDGDDDLGPS